MSLDPRRPVRQDTFDMRQDMVQDEAHREPLEYTDEEHSILEDDSDGVDEADEFLDEDDSSSLSIPNESIDFDLVYSLHTFVATVEGQANVVKGDSLFLMDDTNSYWWLVRVLKTQEVGYIPAENIETPYERLARLNKHRNVDLAAPTPEEQVAEDFRSRNAPDQHAPLSGGRNPNRRTVIFRNASTFHYPPAVWNEEEEIDHEVGDYDPYEGDEHPLNDTREGEEYKAQMEELEMMDEEDIDWDEIGPGTEMNGIGMGAGIGMSVGMGTGGGVPSALQPGGMRVQQQAQVQGATRPLVTGTSQQSQAQGQPHQQQQQRPQQGIQPLGLASQLRQQSSKEQLSPADGPGQVQGRNTPSSPSDPQSFDPAETTETKRINVTPQVAQDAAPISSSPVNVGKLPGGPQLPSEIMQQQRQEQERAQSELAEHSRRMQQQQQLQLQQQQQQRGRDAKLMKQPNSSTTSTNTNQGTSEDEKDRKKRGVFGSLFGGRKDKSKDSKAGGKRANEERPGSASSGFSQDQREREREKDYQGGIGDAPRGPNPSANQPPKSALSPHTRKFQEQDQALYQKYLHSSTRDSPPQPSYATQSMGPYMPASGNSSLRPNDGGVKARPGSLILTSPGLDGPGVPDLNVIRVFAGTNLQTEATFKTALLNSSTTAADLVRQAMQRFRIPAEDERNYFLTVKQQIEGSTTSLQPHEKPLVVFEELVEAAVIPKVKRSSVGSISSVSSNLSMHPAIKKLPMNDFTDDSTVKIYLNRRVLELDGESSERGTPMPLESQQDFSLGKRRELAVSTSTAATVAAERFTSPSMRFAVQVVIYPEDLPDGVVFDPHTEAIVPKSTVKERERAGVNPQPSPGIPMNLRRKVFSFPKNTTVAEVIELGLERFGISEGVVDGGDEVEDKLAKRRSQSRVRYGLSVHIDGQDRELFPASRVVDAFPRPPSFRPVEKSRDARRRSADVNSLLGSVEDVRPNDPVFILRRSVSYRTTNLHRNSLSKGLDELSLYHMQSQRASITVSEASTNDDRESSAPTPRPQVKPPPAQLSRQEIIAAQRAALKAKQGAILSAQVNSEQGVDIVLPDKATLRSARLATESIRYSYIEPDGETYDITDIMDDNWSPQREDSYGRGDLLEAAISKSSNIRQDPSLGEKIDRVLNKIKGNPKLVSSGGRNVESIYLDQDLIVNPPARPERSPSRGGSRSSTPVQSAPQQGQRAQQASVSSSTSDIFSYDSAPYSTGARNIPQESIAEEPEIEKKKPIIVRNNLGISDLLAFIEASVVAKKPVVKDPPPPLSPVDAMLFGPQLDLNELHPLVRDIYKPLVERFDAMDRDLDDLLKSTMKVTSK